MLLGVAEREGRTTMTSICKTLSILACGAAFSAPVVASADEPLQTEYGVSTVLGAGISGFTDQSMRNVVTNDANALWDLRVTLGTHTPIGLDIGYVGTAAGINALTNTQNGTLIGTTAEGALRYNVLSNEKWNPYAFAGIGWQRYDVRGTNFQMSDAGINDYDNSVVFPMGAGLSYRDMSGLVFDLRGTFRANANYGLVLDSPGSSNYAPMHTWEASAAAGYEF